MSRMPAMTRPMPRSFLRKNRPLAEERRCLADPGWAREGACVHLHRTSLLG